MKIKCKCGKTNFANAKVLDLCDIKDFTNRKIYYIFCPNCGEFNITMSEKRISDGTVYINSDLSGDDAFKILMNERKRIIGVIPQMFANNISGWVYGHNVEIKNKKGKVTKIRQYAKGLDTGKTKLLKTIEINTK
ncbi:MAG: hypothetical protein LUB59_06290 [Candidatus Gastranaerophilales bacterium]|nr:hypothetical protein [Candidatus Gastranaerophilales bacterium]